MHGEFKAKPSESAGEHDPVMVKIVMRRSMAWACFVATCHTALVAWAVRAA